MRHHSYLVFSFSEKKNTHKKLNNDKKKVAKVSIIMILFVTMSVSMSYLYTTSDNVRVIADWWVSCRIRI